MPFHFWKGANLKVMTVTAGPRMIIIMIFGLESAAKHWQMSPIVFMSVVLNAD